MRKILSVILTAVMLISSVSIAMLTISAEDPGYTVTEYGSSATLDTATLPSANRLSGTPIYYAYGSNEGVEKPTENGNNQPSAFLYDGKLSQGFNSERDGYRYYNGLNKVKDEETGVDVIQAETNCRFVLDMGKPYNITTFLVAGSSNQNPITSFEIYVGNDKDTLFKAKNKLVSYSRTEGSKNHQYVITLDEAINAKYFGIKILKVDTEAMVATTDASIYLNEFGAYGDLSYTTPTNLTAMPTDKISRIGRETPKTIIDWAGTVSSDPSLSNSGTPNKTVAYTNNLADTDVNGPRLIKANKIISNSTKSRGMRIGYDLYKEFDVSEVLLVSGDKSGSRAPETQWKIFVSNNFDELFDEANFYAWVKDDTITSATTAYQLASVGVKGRYVGIEFIQNYTLTEQVYISEIAVYGNPVGQTENTLPFVKAPGKNVLNGVTSLDFMEGTSTAVNGNVWKNDQTQVVTSSKTTQVSDLFKDEETTTNHWFKVFTSSGGYGAKFRMTADKEYTVSTVMVSASNTKALAYEAYVSNDKDTLFNKENLFASSNLTPVADGITRSSSVLTVDRENYKTGKYFGIKITGAVASDTYLYTIGFYEAQNIDITNPTTAQGKNILEGKTVYWTPGNSTTEAERQYFPSNTSNGNHSVSYLTNNKLADKPGSWGPGIKIWNGYRGKMVYDMSQGVDISSVLISSGYNSSEAGSLIKSYGIFVSNDKSSLFDVSNQVAFYYNDNGASAAQINLEKLGNKVKNVRYIGIYIYDARAVSANIYLGEVAVYGNYSTDAYSIVNEPSADVLALEGTNALKTATTAAEIDNAVLTDGIAVTDKTSESVSIENAEGLKLTYNLGDKMNITSLLVGSVYNNANNIAPLHYRIYLSNDEATLYTDDTLKVDYYNVGYKANSGKYPATAQLFDLAAAENAQYVGFEFISAALDSKTLTLSELAVYATYDMTDKLSGDIKAPKKVYLDGVLVAESASVPSEILAGDHSLVVYDNNSNNNVYIINNGVFTYKSELNNALSTVGTQIRTDDPLAIRFVNSIKTDVKPLTVKYGAVVAKTAALSSKDLLVDSADYKVVNGVAYEKDASDIIFAEDAENVQYTVAIHNIGTKQHLTYYAVRPYMVISDNDVDYTVYGETYEARPYDVAKAALADNAADYSEKVMTYLNNIVENSSLNAVSQALYQSYGLTDESVSASVKNAAADNDRLIRVIQKAMRGEEITLGTLGGSITMGANVTAEERYAKSYSGLLREWLENTFDVKVNLVNAGIGSTTSTFGVHRIEKDLLQYNPDLVILEYAVNETESETTNKTYEDCIRRILASSDDTALILLFTVRYTAANGYYNNQAAQITIGENYDLPMISYMDCVVPLIEDETLIWKGTTNKGNALTTDDIHPSYFGHQIISALLSDYIAGVATDVTTDTATSVAAMPEALNGATFTNAKFYNSCDLPEEWIVSMGSFNAVHDIYSEHIPYERLTHGWKAYSTDEEAPMILDIPGAKSITLLMTRTRKIANGIKVDLTVTQPDGTVTTGRASNYLDSTPYADTSVIYTAEAGKDLNVKIAPNFNDLDGEIVILGIMVGFDEAN